MAASAKDGPGQNWWTDNALYDLVWLSGVAPEVHLSSRESPAYYCDPIAWILVTSLDYAVARIDRSIFMRSQSQQPHTAVHKARI